jgi:hypothetical protein
MNLECSLYVCLVSLFNCALSYSLYSTDGKGLIWNDDLKIWKDTFIEYSKILPHHLAGEIRENCKIL